MLGDIITSDEEREKIAKYLLTEIETATSERSRFITRVDTWRRQREAMPEQEQKNFPWEKASNVCLPIAEITTNGITSMLKSTFSQKHPFFHIKPHKQEMQKHADVLSKYLDKLVESKFHLNLRTLNNDIFYDLASLGTQFIAVPWVEDVHVFKRKNENGVLDEVSVTRHRGPMVVPIRIEDFFCRDYVTDLETAPWVAIRHNLLWHELKQRENQGIYENVDKIKSFVQTKPEENLASEGARIGFDAMQSELYEIMECDLFWDIDNDGVPEDIKIWFEKSSGIVLREELNDLGTRAIDRIVYVSLPKKLYGMGVGWMCEHAQEACNTLFNMSVNAAHLSSSQMFKIKRGSNIGPNEGLYPGKFIEMDDVERDLAPIIFPNVTLPNIQLMGIIRELTDRVTNATSANMGFPDSYAKTRATTSGQMFQAQQGSRVSNSIAENVEEGFARIGQLIVFQLIRNKEKVNMELLDKADQVLLKEVLDMKVEEIHLNFAFSITSTKAEQTEEAKRQMILTLSQLYSMYGQQNLQLLTAMMNTLKSVQNDPKALQPLVEKFQLLGEQLMVGSTKLMGYVLDSVEIERDGYLPYIKDIEMMLNAIAMMKDQQLQGGMNANTANSGQPPNIGGGGAGIGGPMVGGGAQEGVIESNQQYPSTSGGGPATPGAPGGEFPA